jgi:hypothetical protein
VLLPTYYLHGVTGFRLAELRLGGGGGYELRGEGGARGGGAYIKPGARRPKGAQRAPPCTLQVAGRRGLLFFLKNA